MRWEGWLSDKSPLCPQRMRARWNSLDSLFVFGWSGSAMLGGYLIASYGFDTSFLITAFMQLAAWAVLLPLIWLVPRDMAGERSSSACAAAEVRASFHVPDRPSVVAPHCSQASA